MAIATVLACLAAGMGYGCNRTPQGPPAPDGSAQRRLGEGRLDVHAQAVDPTAVGQARLPSPAMDGQALPSEARADGQSVAANGASVDGVAGTAPQPSVDDSSVTTPPIPGLPPAASPLPLSPEVDTLLRMATAAAAEVNDPLERCRLELGIARIESRYSPARAAERIRSCAGTSPDMNLVKGAVLSLAGQDTGAALGVLQGIPDSRRKALVAAIAENQAALDVPGAIAVVLTLESRIVREEMLVALLPAIYRHSPGSVPLLLDRIVEPLLNDFAMARSRTVAAAEGGPPDPAAVEAGIESSLVKRWALLDVALQLAHRLPEAALELSGHLALPLDRDEVYAATAGALTSTLPDKAIGLVLRIGDPVLKAAAAEAVSRELFPVRPAMALHLVSSHLPVRAPAATIALFGALCKREPARFVEVYSEVAGRLQPQEAERLLETCCPEAPREVRRLVSESSEELRSRSWYQVCLVCAALDSDAAATVARVEDPGLRKAGAICLARQLAQRSVEDAVEVIDGLSDPYSRDDARLALFDALLSARDLEKAAAVAAQVQDRYTAARASIRLAATGSEAEGAAAETLEKHLLSVADPWRRDDLLAEATRECQRYPRRARVRLAASVADSALRHALFAGLSAGVSGADVLSAASEVPADSGPSARADWYLALCRLAAGAAPSALAEPEVR